MSVIDEFVFSYKKHLEKWIYIINCWYLKCLVLPWWAASPPVCPTCRSRPCRTSWRTTWAWLPDPLSRSGEVLLHTRWNPACCPVRKQCRVLFKKKLKKSKFFNENLLRLLPDLCRRSWRPSRCRETPLLSCSAHRRSSWTRGGAGLRSDTPSWTWCTAPESEPDPTPHCGSLLVPCSLDFCDKRCPGETVCWSESLSPDGLQVSTVSAHTLRSNWRALQHRAVVLRRLIRGQSD